jgi:hypothetical protein
MPNALDRFYRALEMISRSTGGPVPLHQISRVNCPERGVYFFFEHGETRPGHPAEPRVVRIGTHGLKRGAQATLYGRLRQHRGTAAGLGNSRGSIFRRHVGRAILNRSGGALHCPTWGQGSSASREIRASEGHVESVVSDYIREMQVICLEVPDEPGPESLRGFIERNAIGLLAGQEPASPQWLGFESGHDRLINSFLWNVNHTDEPSTNGFLDFLEDYIGQQIARRGVANEHPTRAAKEL